MRKLSISLGLMLLPFSSTLFAVSDQSVYVSADAGIYQANFNNKYTDQTDVIAQNISQSAQQNGYTAGIALGYRKLLASQYFVGGELSASFNNHLATFQSGASTSAFSDQMQVRNQFNLVFVPGLKLNETITTYLKLGLSLASIQDYLNSPAGFDVVMMETNGNQNTLGFTAGLEVEKKLTNNVSIFLEADYFDYPSVNFPNFQNFSATYSHSTHVYAYDIVFGISYYFLT